MVAMGTIVCWKGSSCLKPQVLSHFTGTATVLWNLFRPIDYYKATTTSKKCTTDPLYISPPFRAIKKGKFGCHEVPEYFLSVSQWGKNNVIMPV